MAKESEDSNEGDFLSGGISLKRGSGLNYDDVAQRKSRLDASLAESEKDAGGYHGLNQYGSESSSLNGEPQVLDDLEKQPKGVQIIGNDHSHQGKAPHLPKICVIEADAAEDKGSRHAMEDAWVVLSDASLDYEGPLRCAHFAIYDGHGGRLAAEYAQKHLHANVLSAGLPHGCKSCKESYS